jgi:tetratricopeptide (TPR) repeat protein
VVKNVERIAQEITVLITFPNGNGSGVIIAQRGNTYYVLTANHVVRNETQYQVSTPDGRCYPVNYRTVKKFEGVDLAVLEFQSDRSYRVATLGNYDLGKENSFVFVSGWAASKQGSDGKPSRMFTAGNLFSQEFASFLTKDSSSFTKGYEMLYTNITAGGVSGGSVLDSRGWLIGIHAAAEGEVTLDEAGQERLIQLGYSLGVPVSSFLSLATKLGIEPGWLKIETSLPLPLTEIEKTSIFESLLPTEIAKDGPDAIVWLNYGNQLWRLEQYKEAVEAFDNAIQYKKGFYQALYARGWAQTRQKRFQEALESFAEATKIEPTFAPAWRLQGIILYILDRYQEALECFDKALALESNYSDIRLFRGDVLSKSQRYSEAIDDFTQVIRLNSTDLCISCAYQGRGNVYFKLEDYQTAINDFNEAIRRRPDESYAYLRRGDAHFIQKKYQEAIADYTEVIRLKPDAAEAHYLRGSIHALQKDYKTAIADFTEAIRLKPDYADAHYYRGISHNENKDYKEAIADFTEVIIRQPYNDDAYLNRSVALDALGYKSRALEDAKKGLLLRLGKSSQSTTQQR